MNLSYNNDTKILKLSMIFKWYSNDFGGKKGMLKFLHKYNNEIPQEDLGVKIEYFKYDWRINSQAAQKTGLTLNI
jgi:hypothetical protein